MSRRSRDDALFTMVERVVWLSRATERNSVVRKLQLLKLADQASMPGLHTPHHAGRAAGVSRTLV
jgi:hypothetical protein